MGPTESVRELIRSVDRDDCASVLARVGARLSAGPWGEADRAGARRHVETLAFRLEGEGRLREAADACDLVAGLGQDRERWTIAAAVLRLRGLCGGGAFEAATAAVADLRAEGTPAVVRAGVAALMQLGWGFECAGAAEPCVQCYRLAHELNGGDEGLATEDGYVVRVKVRNLRRLQFDRLIEDGRLAEAAALHDQTRHVTRSGPLAPYRIVSVEALAASGGASYTRLRPARRIAAPEIRFFEPAPALTSEPGERDLPAQYLAFIDGCRAFPRSNVVIAGEHLVYDLAAHPRRPDVLIQDGVNTDQIMMAAFGATRALVELPEDTVAIEAGLSMFGMQSRNYGHWFCEFVPRMLAYNDPACPDGIPLCIDDHMPGTHEEILRLLDTRDRPVIKLPPKAVAFGRLGLAPVPAFFPFEMKPGRPVYDAIWPADVFATVRERILDRARERGQLSGRTDRRLFISRKAFAQRALVNEADIAARLIPLGFEVIYPETLSFLEQVDAFHSAAVVVGSSSSALSNALFCRPGCRILGLIHEELAFNFRGYASFIEAGGARILFLRGRTLHRPGVHAFHVSYTVEPDTVVSAVAALEREVATGVRAGCAAVEAPPPAGAAGRGTAPGPAAFAGPSPSVAAMVEALGDAPNPAIPRLDGTPASAALERRRVAMVADWLVRTHLPAWFHLAKLNVEADALAGLPELRAVADLAALCAHLKAARKRAVLADLTLRQTGPVVRPMVWDDVHRAAWGCVQEALEGAGPPILAAGWDAAFAAAYAGARACAKAPLGPTRDALRLSAGALVERMVALSDGAG